VSRRYRRDHGFATGAALVMMSLLGLVLATVGEPVVQARAYLSRAAAADAARAQAQAAVEAVIEVLRADPTPGADSFHDPLWARGVAGVVVRECYPPYAGGDGCHAYTNANTASLHRLQDVAAGRLPVGMDSAAALAPLLAVRATGELLDSAGLRLALGDAYEPLSPAITARPLVNANTAGPAVLAEVLAEYLPTDRGAGGGGRRSRRSGGDAWPAALSRMLTARRESELRRGDLPRVLEVPADAPLLAVLGVRSPALELLIHRGGRRFEAVIARVPGAGGTAGTGARYQVLRLREAGL
jgi:hypothetical protein